jgi:hypothetical protein
LPAAAQERVALAAELKEDMRDERAMANVESSWRSRSLVEHDLFGKPVPTFPDHALDENARRKTGHFSFIDLCRG